MNETIELYQQQLVPAIFSLQFASFL